MKNFGVEIKKKIDIKISKDFLAAYLTIFPPNETQSSLTLTEVKNALLKAGVTYGIDEVKIMIAIAENKGVNNLLVAQGEKPLKGKDAQIKYHFAEKGIEIKPKELKDGRVDFYNINLIQNVKKGELLLEKFPASEGKSGMSVFGKEIPPIPGKDIRLPVGKNISISDNNLQGFAACEGHVVITNGKVSVLEVLEINSDISFATGNIDYVGNVIIRGNIKDGFKVNAQGDVEIHGTVEGGHVFSDGNIVIKKGVRGLKKSRVEAKRNVYSNFIEQAFIKAGEDVIVNEGILHSEVNSGLTVKVGGRKGLVSGGICRAGQALVCKNIGSSFATSTTIEVGINPELRLAFNEVSKELTHVKKNLDKTLKALKILGDIKEKIKHLPPDKIELEKRLILTRAQLFKKNEELNIKKEALEEKNKELEESFIKVSGTIHGGVNVTIGKVNKGFNEEIKNVILKQNGVDISIMPLTNN